MPELNHDKVNITGTFTFLHVTCIKKEQLHRNGFQLCLPTTQAYTASVAWCQCVMRPRNGSPWAGFRSSLSSPWAVWSAACHSRVPCGSFQGRTKCHWPGCGNRRCVSVHWSSRWQHRACCSGAKAINRKAAQYGNHYITVKPARYKKKNTGEGQKCCYLIFETWKWIVCNSSAGVHA